MSARFPATRFVVLCIAILLSLPAMAKVNVDVQVDRPTHAMPEMLYGVFYEDINYAADGGLYAELVQNRSFEYYVVPRKANAMGHMTPLCAWQLVTRGGGEATLAVEKKTPLNDKNTHYAKLTIKKPGQGVGLRNTGYGGIYVKKGEAYDVSLYAQRTASHNQPVTVSLESQAGKVLASATIPALTGDWKKYAATLTPAATDEKASLVVTTAGTGDVLLDMISLFPRKTFKGRKNGLRPDLAQAIADLKPKTFRFPGGCVVHGHGLDNAYRWKDTVGDVAQRKPNWNLWGYHQSYGLGYFEYFQFCEDIGAEPLPILATGVSCGFRSPRQNAPLEQLQPWIDDALDLIEFANGPVDSKWGKVRAEMGHPKPFGLKLLGLGNEDHDTKAFRKRFALVLKAVREKHPEIKIVGTSGLGGEIPMYEFMNEQKVFVADEHYYVNPEAFIGFHTRFDKFDPNKVKVYVGEYATRGNAQFNAVAEACFLTGIERNANKVIMTAYAPLLARYGFTQWPRADLIWFDHKSLVLTPNYYVQKLFSLNKGDTYLPNKVTVLPDSAPAKTKVTRKLVAGKVGVGTWKTQAAFDDIKVVADGKTVIDQTFAKGAKGWKSQRGKFVVKDGAYQESDAAAAARYSRSLCLTPIKARAMTYTLRAKKIAGEEGFQVVFCDSLSDTEYSWNIGGWRNTLFVVHGLGGEKLIEAKGHIETGRWYDIRIEVEGERVRCYLDGKLIHDVSTAIDNNPARRPLCISSTFDQTANEVILKLANPSTSPQVATVNLETKKTVRPNAKCITLAGGKKEINSRENPNKVKPVISEVAVGKSFTHTVPAMSVQIIRIRLEK
jgi:alpha-L-arabinofuranosidase